MAELSSEEISELKRLSGQDDFPLYLAVYSTIKDGFRGEDAREKINEEMTETKHIDEIEYNAILRTFRERSTLLRTNKEDKTNPLLIKLKGKLQDLIDGITKDKIKKASLNSIATAMGITFDKMRLLENKPTLHVASAVAVAGTIEHKVLHEIQDLKKEMDRLVEFAQANNLDLPDRDKFMDKLKQSG